MDSWGPSVTGPQGLLVPKGPGGSKGLCAPRAPYFHFVDRWSIFLEIIKKAAMAFYQLGSIMHMQFVLQMKARFRF